MLAGRDINRKLVAIVDHDAIDPHIDPAFVRILRDHDMRCSYISAAVLIVPLGDWKLEQVDLLAGKNVLQNRSTIDILRRDQLRVVQTLLPHRNEFVAPHLDGKIGRQRCSLERLDHSNQHAIAGRIIFDVIE